MSYWILASLMNDRYECNSSFSIHSPLKSDVELEFCDCFIVHTFGHSLSVISSAYVFEAMDGFS